MTISTNTQAAKKHRYGMAGCGLGSMVMGSEGMQISAATTNSTYGNQGFAITSGTSNCKASNAELAEIKQEDYFLTNLSNLSKEMAKGEGEALDGLASLLGCGQGSLTQFKSFAKNHYSEIFSEPGAVAALEYLKTEMKNDQTLSQACISLSDQQS